MSLRADDTLESFVDKLSRNQAIMDILNLPTILDTDDENIKIKKRVLLIDKVITKTAQEPYELAKLFPKVNIDKIEYSKYGDTRITIALIQSIKTNSYLFGNPQVEINIYYDNTKDNKVFKLLDLISDEFSGQDLIVKTEDEKHIIKHLKCEGITSQVAIINNYERVGIRFSFYATLYKN